MYSLVLMTALSTGGDPIPPPAPLPIASLPGVPLGAPVPGVPPLYTPHYSYLGFADSGYMMRTGSPYALSYGVYGSPFQSWSCHGAQFYGAFDRYGLYVSPFPPQRMPPAPTIYGYSPFGLFEGRKEGIAPAPVYYGMLIPPEMPPLKAPVLPPSSDSNVTPPDVKRLPPVPMPPEMAPSPSDKKPAEVKNKDGMGASLKFRLPAQTRLYIDGKLIEGTGSVRELTTPVLPAGQKFFYRVKAEFTIEGALIVEERHVIVEAGAVIEDTFTILLAAAGTTKETTVAGK